MFYHTTHHPSRLLSGGNHCLVTLVCLLCLNGSNDNGYNVNGSNKNGSYDNVSGILIQDPMNYDVHLNQVVRIISRDFLEQIAHVCLVTPASLVTLVSLISPVSLVIPVM